LGSFRNFDGASSAVVFMVAPDILLLSVFSGWAKAGGSAISMLVDCRTVIGIQVLGSNGNWLETFDPAGWQAEPPALPQQINQFAARWGSSACQSR
jgi:hypothetical protein